MVSTLKVIQTGIKREKEQLGRCFKIKAVYNEKVEPEISGGT